MAKLRLRSGATAFTVAKIGAKTVFKHSKSAFSVATALKSAFATTEGWAEISKIVGRL